jgi:hypothetical protein
MDDEMSLHAYGMVEDMMKVIPPLDPEHLKAFVVAVNSNQPQDTFDEWIERVLGALPPLSHEQLVALTVAFSPCDPMADTIEMPPIRDEANAWTQVTQLSRRTKLAHTNPPEPPSAA